MEHWLNRVEFSGSFVELLPLALTHKEALADAASDGELWKLWFTGVPSVNSIDNYIETALRQQQSGTSLPFVVIEKESQKIIGCTRLCNAESQNRRVEIGYTWYAESRQRTPVNTETKLLLLTHAFETLEAASVVFQTHFHNFKSRNAIERLGAKLDGILRNHRIIDGLFRDTAIYSILENEWPTVKHGLEARLPS